MPNTTNIGLMGVNDDADDLNLANYLRGVENFIQAIGNEDLILVATPTALGTTAAAASAEGFTRDVAIKLTNTAGTTIAYTGNFGIAVSNGSSSAGVVAIEDSATEVTLTRGVGSVTLEYSGTWAAEDVCTFTITGSTVAKITVANKTSVDTIVA